MRLRMWLTLALTFLVALTSAAYRSCVPRRYQLRSDISCVCNATYCDEFPPIGKLSGKQAVIYSSTIAGARFLQSRKTFESAHNLSSFYWNACEMDVILNPAARYQTILGFGGAFTDAASINLNRLSKDARANLLNAYFADNGIEYTLGRVPMASCDFSTRVYSYCDTPDDFALKSFNLTDEDFKLKMPFIREAQVLAKSLRLFTSPWSAPGWMKESGKMKGGSMLNAPFNGKYYLTWANYYRRFFEEYQKAGINFWGLTIQNEPSAGVFKNFAWQAMYYTPMMIRDFVKTILGPLLKSNSLTKNIKIIAHDDQRYLLPLHAEVMLQDEEAAKYIDGIGVHWYGDFLVEAKRLTTVHKHHPTKFILGTEACSGYVPLFGGPVFGDWYRGEEYAYRIIEDLENWMAGWTDWNMCLNEQGGPNLAANYVDAPIIVNNTIDEFYKQPMYYALGHFSKFIRPGSVRIGLKLKNYCLVSNTKLSATAFLNPQRNIVVVLLNRHPKNSYTIRIRNLLNNADDVSNNDDVLNLTMSPNSIVTVLWRYNTKTSK